MGKKNRSIGQCFSLKVMSSGALNTKYLNTEEYQKYDVFWQAHAFII